MSDISKVHATAAALRDNLGRVIVGKAASVELLLAALLAQGHVLIEDVPGLGKTMLAKALARSLGCSFQRIQFTPDLLPSDITGVNVFNQKSGEFEFRPGPIAAEIVLADEINRAGPRTQSALLEAMEERQATVGAVIGAILVAGLAVAEAVSPGVMEQATSFLRPALRWIDSAFQFALTLLAFVIIWIVEPLFVVFDRIALILLQLLRLLQNIRLPELPRLAPGVRSAVTAILNSPAFRMGSRGVAVLAVLAIFVFVTWLVLRRFRLARKPGIEEVRESVLSRELLWRQIKDLFRRRKRPAASPPPFLMIVGPDDDPRVIARRAYQAMLAWAASGLTRAPRQTPAAYAARLAQAQPEAREPVAVLTEVYVRARYGFEPPSLEEARLAEAAAVSLTPSPSPDGRGERG